MSKKSIQRASRLEYELLSGEHEMLSGEHEML
jgi:hypothetical protein